MNLASIIRRDFAKLLRGGNANSADVTVIWNAASTAGVNPNLEDSYVTPAPTSGTWPAMVHYVQPTTSGIRQFAEIQPGDVIVDFEASLPVPDGAKGATFKIEGNPKTWVQKNVGQDLADAWELVVGGQRVMKTFLLTSQTQ